MYRLTAKCQSLKRQRSRGSSARVDVERIELPGERSDHPARPAIERMRQAVPSLGGVCEAVPLQAAGESQKNDGSERRERVVELAGIRKKRAAHREAAVGRTPT